MAHRYGHPIRVICDAGHPHHFSWRDDDHLIVEIFATWHLRDRWWTSFIRRPNGVESTIGTDSTGASDRHYYRVLCADGLLCDLYHDAAQDGWVLDRVHD